MDRGPVAWLGHRYRYYRACVHLVLLVWRSVQFSACCVVRPVAVLCRRPCVVCCKYDSCVAVCVLFLVDVGGAWGLALRPRAPRTRTGHT